MTTPSPTPESIARKWADRFHYADPPYSRTELVVLVKEALLEVTQPLLKRIEELENQIESVCQNSATASVAFAKENAELRQCITDLEQQLDQHAHDFKQLRDTLNCDGSDLPQLLKAINDLERDKVRLDKMESAKWQIYFNHVVYCFLVQDEHQATGHIGKGNTVREAIDSAISTQQPKEGKRV